MIETKPLCTDECEHAECGDFICDITEDATTVDWCPFECQCPEKRRLVKHD